MSCKLHPWFMPTAKRRQKPHPRFKPSVRYHALLPNEPRQLQPRFTPSFGHPYSSQVSPSEILMGTLQTRPTRYRYPTRPDSLTSLTPRRVIVLPLAASTTASTVRRSNNHGHIYTVGNACFRHESLNKSDSTCPPGAPCSPTSPTSPATPSHYSHIPCLLQPQ